MMGTIYHQVEHNDHDLKHTFIDSLKSKNTPLITTNGMFISDTVITKDGRKYDDIPGGAGTYAMVGASIVAVNKELSSRIYWIVDRGFDFPSKLTSQLNSWNTNIHYRDDKSRNTTKGLNTYVANDLRKFKYTTAKKQIDVEDWVDTFGTKALHEMKCIHLICSITRLETISEGLTKYGKKTIIWEPLPDDCQAVNKLRIEKLAKKLSDIVISPNTEEASRIFDQSEPSTLDGCFSLAYQCSSLLHNGNKFILRCGKYGSITIMNDNQIENGALVWHLPAFHQITPDKVQDPTGGGNAFLGAFTFSFAITDDITAACVAANVAAGCVVEQIGMPVIDDSSGIRYWNSISFEQRLTHYLRVYNIKSFAGYVYPLLFKKQST